MDEDHVFAPVDTLDPVLKDLEAGLDGVLDVREVQIEREPPFAIIFTGHLQCDAATALPILEQRFAANGCVPLIRQRGQQDMVVAVEHVTTASPSRVWLSALLFVATFVTTTAAGATLAGADLLRHPLEFFSGLPFSVTLLIILATHEMGHYAMGKWYGVPVSLPYFIPIPFSLLGTFGAFIRMSGPIRNRQQLFDVGFAGPLAGLVVALPLFMIGLVWSDISRVVLPPLGDSLLTAFLKDLLHPTLPGRALAWHPVAIAAYFGILLTGVNLLPAGQLDGGHIAYAVFGRAARPVAIATLAILVLMGWLVWAGWYVWAVFILITGFRHPTPLDDVTRLDRGRIAIGLGALIILVLTLIPAPFPTF